MKTVKVGFLGLGVVGAELVNIIIKNTERIYEKYGIKLELGKIYVRDTNKKRSVDITNLEMTTNPYEVLDDKDTAIICECVGGAGTEGTREYIEQAVKSGKSVVLSSKKVLALYGMDLLDLAIKNNVAVKFDATVGGGIPVAKIIKE